MRKVPVAALAVAALAAFVPSRAAAAGLLIADGGFGGRLEIVEHEVKVVVNNGVAVTEVTQVFRNTESRQVEALYTFPVPEGASVANFSMWINGKEMVGEVVEKERAREIYNSYKQRKRDPGLLEQTDFKTFEMRIFPIAPKAEQRVQIAYYQELDFDHDWATYVYPLASTTRSQAESRVQGRFAASLEVRSAVPVVAMESPSHREDFLITKHTEHYYEASLERQEGDLGRDIVLAFKASRPSTGIDLITSRQKGEDGFFSMILTAGEELAKAQQGADYVFILDVSGSMANDRKLSDSRHSVESFVEALAAEDRFEIITFNTQPNPLFRSLVPADEGGRAKAAAYLGSRQAVGGTRLQPALGAAYRYASADRVLNVVVLSDGLTEQAERAVLMEAIRSRPGNVRVFCIGVGNEINRPLLKQVAEDAGGIAAFLSKGDDFERQARAFRRKLTHPVATDIRIVVGGVEVYDLDPEEIPNLYYGKPLRLYGRYRGQGEAKVSLSATVNGREIEQSAILEFPARDDGNPEIERMWAWHRLQTLQEEREMKGGGAAVDEIVRLGEAFSIASEYTSFIVLENDGEYQRWRIERRNALRLDRDRKAQQETRRQLESLRQRAVNDIGPVEAEAQPPGEQVAQGPAKPPPDTRKSAPPAPRPSSGRSIDLNFPVGGGGGGAVDPFTGMLALALAGGGLLRSLRRR